MDQQLQPNRLYREMRIGVAQSELSRNNGGRVLAPGYACVLRAEWVRRYRDTVLPKGAHLWFQGDDGLWWFRKNSASTTEGGVYLVRFSDHPGPIKLPSPPGTLHDLNGGPYEVLGASRSTKPVRSLGDPT